MSQSSFGDALLRLWPKGAAKIPGLRAGMIAAAPAVFSKHEIVTPLLVAQVMAQISQECGAGSEVVENLDYSAARMMQVWPTRFPTLASAQPYAGNPRALANKVYNGRMGNAIGSDDGWNFRRRGAVQTTGREGYARLAKATGLDVVNHPDLVNDPSYFLECGVADFIACGCLPFADADDVVNVTRRLNGGTVGLAQRRAWLAQWKAALGSAPIVIAPAPLSPPPAAPPSMVRPDPAPQASPAAAPLQSALSKFIRRSSLVSEGSKWTGAILPNKSSHWARRCWARRLFGPLGGAAGEILAKALGSVTPTPAAVQTVLPSADPAALAEAEARWSELIRAEAETQRTAITETQTTMRAEIASEDPVQRWWRPAYAFELTFIARRCGRFWCMNSGPETFRPSTP